MPLPESVKKVVQNPRVKSAAAALLLAILAALGLSLNSGCHELTPAQQAKVDRFDCQVKAVATLVGPAVDANSLVLDLYAGKADLAAAAALAGATREDAEAFLKAWGECQHAREPSAQDAGVPQ